MSTSHVMTMKGRRELRRIAFVLILFAVLLLLTVAALTPAYLRYRVLNWDQMFRTEKIYREFTRAFTAILFGVAPTTAVLLAATATSIFKHTRVNEDDDNTA